MLHHCWSMNNMLLYANDVFVFIFNSSSFFSIEHMLFALGAFIALPSFVGEYLGIQSEATRTRKS